jgi:hypothetical protein
VVSQFEIRRQAFRLTQVAAMMGAMTSPERVFAFLILYSPQPYCDDCISKGADVVPRQGVNTIAETLALTSEFERHKGDLQCTECKESKIVTRALPRH